MVVLSSFWCSAQSVLVCMAIIIVLFQQTHGAQDRPLCAPSSCGKIHNITYPFRLKGNPPGCGLPRYELDCIKNVTVFTLFSGKYHVQNINYKTYKIQLTDAGVEEDTACSIPRYFISLSNFTFIGGPDNYATDPLTFWNWDETPYSPPYVAFLNCTDPVTDDPRYVEVCDSGGHVYAVLASSHEFTVMDIKVGCHLKAATFTNNNLYNNVSYSDIHKCLHNGFSLYWVIPVICIEQCGKAGRCLINHTTHQIGCGQNYYCQVLDLEYEKSKCGEKKFFYMQFFSLLSSTKFNKACCTKK